MPVPEARFVTKVAQNIYRMWCLAFGTDLLGKVGSAYQFLMDHWEAGDRVFLFGFSRGAYTVRVLAGLLHSFGLLPRGRQNQVPYLLRMYAGLREGVLSGMPSRDYWKLCSKFRKTFARPIPTSRLKRFEVHFLGVWDTVSSVGWVWNPKTYPYTAKNPSVRSIRHAISIDERRWLFRQNQFRPNKKKDVIERWLPGVHADVGGGYRENEGGLWRIGFTWMVEEATKNGLVIDASSLQHALSRTKLTGPSWAEPIHTSLTWRWMLAEIVAKSRGRKWGCIGRLQLGLCRWRTVPRGALICEDALERLRDEKANYNPKSLSVRFREAIRRQSKIDGDQPYVP